VPPSPRACARHLEDAHAAFVDFVRWTIVDEYPRRAEFLTDERLTSFSDYYAHLPPSTNRAAVAHYVHGLWRGEPGWASRWIAAHRHPIVLDAGCGFGTFSMLFASMGGRVLGVDLRPDRLAVAEQRLDRHATLTGTPLELSYARQDLTREWSQPVDMVWAYNSISHIDPLDAFLDQACEFLRPGGVLVISDINGAHRHYRRRPAALRKEVHQQYVAPDGQRHAYAVERTFAPQELRSMVVARGFEIVTHHLYARGLNRLPESWNAAVVEPLRSMHWLWPGIATRQLLVAAPRDST